MLPTYLVIGAAKCGTSSLCHSLGEHPDVFMSIPKEIHYFGRNDPDKTLAWYLSFFQEAVGQNAIGEGSTSYTHPDIIEACAAEIAERIPSCRLIYMVRDPVDRLESDWKMRLREGWSAASINEAVQSQPSLVTHGLYWQNLSVYRRHFSDEQILVVFLEDFSREPERELQRCFTHIGVAPDVVIDDAHKARNAAASFRRDSAISGWLRGTAFFGTVQRRSPRWLVRAAKSLLTSEVNVSLAWDPSVKARVMESFADDSRRFLEFCGKEPDFWTPYAQAR